MKDWMLTDEELDFIWALTENPPANRVPHICKGQARKIVEYMEREMIAETQHSLGFLFLLLDKAKWQQLRKEVGL